jgi:hypothetical protein
MENQGGSRGKGLFQVSGLASGSGATAGFIRIQPPELSAPATFIVVER